MSNSLSLSEIETLIRNNIKSKGLMNDISEEKIQEIKNKIKKRLSTPSTRMFYMAPILNPDNNGTGDFAGGGDGGGGLAEADSQVTLPVPNETPEDNITHSTVVDEKSMALSRKEGELNEKEKALISKEQELNIHQGELERKEQELKYKPQLPSFILKSQPAQLFIYDNNELSTGSESLCFMQYGMVNSPDTKKSMHDLWLEEGKIKSEIFKVEFKKIGELNFDPVAGTCKFSEMTQPIIPDDLSSSEADSVQKALNSQQPTEPMIDSVSPVTDVILPASNDMGLNTPDVQKSMQDVIEKALADYLRNKGVE